MVPLVTQGSNPCHADELGDATSLSGLMVFVGYDLMGLCYVHGSIRSAPTKTTKPGVYGRVGFQPCLFSPRRRKSGN